MTKIALHFQTPNIDNRELNPVASKNSDRVVAVFRANRDLYIKPQQP